jgi:hypothetical protein
MIMMNGEAKPPYETDDLKSVRTLNYEKIIPSVETALFENNQQAFSDGLRRCNIESVVNTFLDHHGEGTVVIYDEKHLEEICSNPNPNINKVFYMQVEALSHRANGYIASIANAQKIPVTLIPIGFADVATIGQINYELNVQLKNCHTFLFVAENHDIYSQYLKESIKWEKVHLIVPDHVKPLWAGLTTKIYMEIAEETIRFLNNKDCRTAWNYDRPKYEISPNQARVHV